MKIYLSALIIALGALVCNAQTPKTDKALVAATTKAGVSVSKRSGGQPKFTGSYIPETPIWPDSPDKKWLTYHLAHPGPGNARPGDPNSAFFWKGRYHLHYIYKNRTGFVFAHVSSDDMVRWEWHKTVLAPPTTGHGMFSGTGFITKDGRAAMVYHGEGSGGTGSPMPWTTRWTSGASRKSCCRMTRMVNH